MIVERADSIVHDMAEMDISFPVICKPIEACSTPTSHVMVRIIVDVLFDIYCFVLS